MEIEETNVAQPDYLDTIAAFVASTDYEDLPEEVRRHAKYVWLDTAGVIMAGSLEPQPSALAKRLAHDRGSATVLRPGFPHCDAANAALLNGTAGTFLELDEGHRPSGHPAMYIVPSVLALAEANGATGKQLIEALVLAYEVSSRLSWATRLIRGIHIHGSLGVVGAAVGAARLLGYDAPRIREAINIASCLNGATPSLAAFEGALVRNVYAGFSGHMGVLIADLVESGFTGLFDGPSETYTKLLAHSFDPECLVDRLGEEFEISTNYFKLHAACRHLHAPLDALDQALGGRAVQPEEVKRVRVAGNSQMVACGRTSPVNPLAAKFSVPFAIATSIVRKNTGIEGFRHEAVDNPATRSLAQRVALEEDQSFSQVWPQENPARVEVVLTTGETLVGQVNKPRGDQPSPISYAEVKDKFSRLTSAIFPGGNAVHAMNLFLHMEEMPQASELTAALRELASREAVTA